MERSADSFTGVIAVSRLLSGLGSGVPLETIAVLEIIPEAVELTIPRMSTVRTESGGSVPRLREPVHVVHVAPLSTEYSAPVS